MVAGISEQMLAEREETQLLEIVDELLASDSDNVQALRLLVRAHWWQRDMENLKAALERLAEAAAGGWSGERRALCADPVDQTVAGVDSLRRAAR